MEDNYIQRINGVFNEQLQQQIAGILKPGHVYKLVITGAVPLIRK